MYIFKKVLEITYSKLKLMILGFTSFFISSLMSVSLEYNEYLSKLFFIFVLCTLLILISKSTLQVSLPISIISIGISYCIRAISVFLTGIIGIIINVDNTNIIIGIILALLHVSLTLLFLKIKRVKKGLSFFVDKNNLGVGLFISGFIIIFACIGTNETYISDQILSILIVGTVISSIGLFLWIRKSITEHYRKRLQVKAEEHYHSTLAEKDEYIEQLNNSNAYLSKVVHRDNHLMSSLKYSIQQYKNCTDETEKQKILDEILTLTNEREDLLIKEQKANKVLQATGSAVIDGALGNMYIKAVAHNIDFSLIVNDEIHYLINNIISQTDLETLLCDHIKDAIIAIDSSNITSGKILVTIGMVENIYEISIKDNGVDFDIDTLSKLGLERVTTHKNTGGSGIGFMTTFETLNKTGTSLIITEYENKVPFSKSITFRFDGMNSFVIKSYRSDLLKADINRDDIIIIPTN